MPAESRRAFEAGAEPCAALGYAWPVRGERLLVIAAGIGALVLIALAVVYWVEPSGSLPSFFPGYQAGSTHVHFKHGLACLLLGLVLGVYVWFRTGPKRPARGA